MGGLKQTGMPVSEWNGMERKSDANLIVSCQHTNGPPFTVHHS